jgi:ribosome-binding protein aMBF1 (putative translation factor)
MAISKDDIVERNFRITNNNAIDMHVGKRVRLRRTLLGMSQEQLGAELNVTFQQVQKYERGANRISASRLWDISQILDVPISYFSMICRKAQCVALRAGSAVAIMQTF